MSTIPSDVHKAEIATITDKIALLRTEEQALVVQNQDEYTRALLFVKGVRAYKKTIGFRHDPGIQSAREHLNFLREEKDKHIRPIDEIDKAVSARAGAWRENERLAAAAEERRVNEERRRVAAEQAEAQRRADEAQAKLLLKQRQKEIEQARKSGELKQREANRLAKEAEAQAERDRQAAREAEEAARQVKEVKVKPAIPKMAGIMGRTNWKFRIVNEALIPREYLMWNDGKIGEMVRRTKDKEKSEAECPGIEVWSKDAV